MAAQPESDVDEEAKETTKTIFGGKKAPSVEQQLAKATLRDPTQNTITRMVKQFNEKKPAQDSQFVTQPSANTGKVTYVATNKTVP